MRRHLARIGLVLALALFAAACSSGGSNDGGGGGSTGGGGSAGGGASAGGGGNGGAGGTTITVQGFAFSPNQISVAAGSVTLTVKNEDTTEHTFTLDDGSSDTDLPAGSTETVDLDVTKTVGYHCTIHPSMTGTIQVT